MMCIPMVMVIKILQSEGPLIEVSCTHQLANRVSLTSLNNLTLLALRRDCDSFDFNRGENRDDR